DVAARVAADGFVVLVAAARAAVLRRAVFVAPFFTAPLRAVVLDPARFAAVFLAPRRAATVFREPFADCALFFALRPVGFRLATLRPPQGRILSLAPRGSRRTSPNFSGTLDEGTHSVRRRDPCCHENGCGRAVVRPRP